MSFLISENPDKFQAMHITATKDDLVGNNGIGRYILLPGSTGRARQIAEHFHDMRVNHHPRGYDLYLGELLHNNQKIQVATVQSGMGCPSMEIILHELAALGGKRFLRVGTAGGLQPTVNIGDLINVQASVRDEQTTKDYVPVCFPAVSSMKTCLSVMAAAEELNLSYQCHTGIVHCKSSYYAREFGHGPRKINNEIFIKRLIDYGVLASEMETAALLVQSQLYDHQLRRQGTGPQYRVYAGAILGILSTPPKEYASPDEVTEITANMIMLALATVKHMATNELALIDRLISFTGREVYPHLD